MSTLGRWQAWKLRRSTRGDRVFATLTIVLALLAIAFGRQARSSVAPRTAVEHSRTIDDLEQPSRLPNAPLADRHGVALPLLDRLKKPRAAIAFYASWCGPCQKELPELARYAGTEADLVVVVSADEDLEETQRALANLGLGNVGFYVDKTGALAREGRVNALPTTFVITARGAVIARSKGYSFMGLYRLGKKLAPDAHDPMGFE